MYFATYSVRRVRPTTLQTSVLSWHRSDRFPPKPILLFTSVYTVRYRQKCERAREPSGGPRYIGIAEREAAEKHIGKPKAGSTCTPVMRRPLSNVGERERADGCFVTRRGAASPGPGTHFPKTSAISPRGCPVFAAPNAVDTTDWKRRNEFEKHQGLTPGRPKSTQIHRRWPTYMHSKHGGISDNLRQDSPGPGLVNVAGYDPFRHTSFLKTDVCHPPPSTSAVCSFPWSQEAIR